MSFELQAKTEPGAHLIALAERLAGDFVGGAAAHDREASFPFECVDALKEANFFAAPIPEEHGGLGVGSVHDVLVASSRLARGDASVAIGVNMHLTAVMNLVRRWNMAVAAGNDRRAARSRRRWSRLPKTAWSCRPRSASRARICCGRRRPRRVRRPAGSSRAEDLLHRLPRRNRLYAAVTLVDDEGIERYGFAMIPTDAPGVRVHGDWDAMGMRASGSHSITFDRVELQAAALRGGFPIGDAVPYMERNLTAGLFHGSASLGIAEAAHLLATSAIVARGRGLDDGRREFSPPRTQSTLAPAARCSRGLRT